MRYRALDANNDYVFGRSLNGFYIDVPQAVAQACMTRLQLYLGEWFLDTSDGTPWETQVLGMNTGATRDFAIRLRVLGTQGVTAITNYDSVLTDVTRAWNASLDISTAYGPATVQLPQ